MQTYLKTRPTGIQFLLYIGMAFGLFTIAVYIGMSALAKITGISVMQFSNTAAWDFSNPHLFTFVRGLLLLQFLMLWCLPAFLFAYFSDPQPLNYLGLKAPSSAFYWPLALLLLVVAFPFVEYIGYLNQKLPIGGGAAKWMKDMEEEATRQISFMLSERTTGGLLKNLLFIAVFAGIGEELCFRGIVQRMAIRLTGNPWMGIVIAATLFSAFHFQFYGFFPRLFLGILLGAIYWYSGSLWPAILAHFLYDAIGVYLLSRNPQQLQNPEAGLIPGNGVQLLTGAVVSLTLTLLVLRQMQRKSVASYEAVYSDDFPKPSDNFSF